MAEADQKIRRVMLSTPELEALGERCLRFQVLLSRTLLDFLQNDGPLPLVFLNTAWQEAINPLMFTGLTAPQPLIVERPAPGSPNVP